MAKIKKTDKQWQDELTPEQYEITRQKATEVPFSGELNAVFKEGSYYCICCGAKLFESATKFDAGCGWPSFSAPVDNALDEHSDPSIPGRPRTEVVCHQCDAHLGHVFDDGPGATGLRYCINSVALKFEGKE